MDIMVAIIAAILGILVFAVPISLECSVRLEQWVKYILQSLVTFVLYGLLNFSVTIVYSPKASLRGPSVI
jgi:hypothetical protein